MQGVVTVGEWRDSYDSINNALIKVAKEIKTKYTAISESISSL